MKRSRGILTRCRDNIRTLAYLALDENDQNFYEGRICKMRNALGRVACLLFPVFVKALGRASSRTGFEGTPLFSASGRLLSG